MVLKEGLTRHWSAIAVFMPELLEAEGNSGSMQSVGGPQKLEVPALCKVEQCSRSVDPKSSRCLEELHVNTRLCKVQQLRRQKLQSEESLDSSVRSELEMLMDFGNIPIDKRKVKRVEVKEGASGSTDASEASSRHTSPSAGPSEGAGGRGDGGVGEGGGGAGRDKECGGKEGMEAGEREATSTTLSLFDWLSTPWCQGMRSQVPSHALTTSKVRPTYFLHADVFLEDGHVISQAMQSQRPDVRPTYFLHADVFLEDGHVISF
jgi:hypothetical protein